jgi:glycosyltransferase involved in cell wall biosynthesis
MNVLVVLPFAPWPVRVRSANLWPRIGREAEVHIVYLAAGLAQGSAATQVENVASLEAVPGSRVRSLLRVAAALPAGDCLRAAWHRDDAARDAVEAAYARIKPDVVYVERLRAFPLVERLPMERVVLDPTDSLPLFCESVSRQRGAPALQRIVSAIERPRLIAMERDAYARAACVVACSAPDAEAMAQSSPGAHIELIANGVDLGRFTFETAHKNGHPKVLMSGNFGYWPNAEAARWLLGRARALRECWNSEVVFAGANPPPFLRSAERRGQITVSGYVSDMAAQYHRTSVVAAPVRFATGTQNKVLEAMACGRPVVATPQCTSGLEPCGRAAAVESTRDTFLDALGSVVQDEARQRRLAEAGRAYVEEHHDWYKIAPQMLAVLARVAGKEPSTCK